MGGKVCLSNKGKTLLGDVNKLFVLATFLNLFYFSNLYIPSSFPTFSTLDDGPQSRPSSSGSGFSGIDQSILSSFVFMDLTELFIAISSLWSKVPVSNFLHLNFSIFDFLVSFLVSFLDSITLLGSFVNTSTANAGQPVK